ncbi:MAG: hypothetical protein A2X81_14350 [Desulfobacterales bacterium GWB2_56_26]|nr:MAG: hypothetical protein A2X81_14350 [Desulfobacterales bacterium GWB2_56_26]
MGNNVSVMLEKLYIDHLQRTTEKNETAAPFAERTAKVSPQELPQRYLCCTLKVKKIYISRCKLSYTNLETHHSDLSCFKEPIFFIFFRQTA